MRVVRSAICYLGLHTIIRGVCVCVWTHTYTFKISRWHAWLLSEAWKYTPWHPMMALLGRVPQKLNLVFTPWRWWGYTGLFEGRTSAFIWINILDKNGVCCLPFRIARIFTWFPYLMRSRSHKRNSLNFGVPFHFSHNIPFIQLWFQFCPVTVHLGRSMMWWLVIGEKRLLF